MSLDYNALEFEWYDKHKWPMLTPRPTLKLGMWEVGYVEKDYTTAAMRGKREMACLLLPGLPSIQGHFATVGSAKEAVEVAVTWWIYHLKDREERAPVKRVSRTRQREEPVRVRRTRSIEEEPVARVRRAPRAL